MIDFETLPLYWVNRLSALARRQLGTIFRNAGQDVSPEEWAILMLLWQKDAQNPGAMSARTVRDPTTMTRLIDAMVRKGLVHRRTSTSDRRRSDICLTKAGQGLQAPLLALASPMIAKSQQGLSQDDVDITLRTLKRMAENLANADPKGGQNERL